MIHDPKPHPTAPYIDIFDWFRDGVADKHPDWSIEEVEELTDKLTARYAR